MATDNAPKMVEIREQPSDELQAALLRAKDELFRLELARSTNQLENTMKIRAKRKEVARIMTVLTERKRGAAQKTEQKGQG
jgi:large subunit ribosomal protein L29